MCFPGEFFFTLLNNFSSAALHLHATESLRISKSLRSQMLHHWKQAIIIRRKENNKYMILKECIQLFACANSTWFAKLVRKFIILPFYVFRSFKNLQESSRIFKNLQESLPYMFTKPRDTFSSFSMNKTNCCWLIMACEISFRFCLSLHLFFLLCLLLTFSVCVQRKFLWSLF